MQVLNLAVKLYLTNPEQTEVLCQYLFSLARYDENYDIRDRARFLKPFIFPSNGETVLSKQAKRIFLSAKPAPLLVSQYCREQFQLGSLAHYLNARTNGYHDLPTFPKKAPDSSVRGVENAVHENSNNFEQNDNQDWENRSAKGTNKSNKKDKSFYSDSNESENDSEESSSSEDDSSDENSGSDSSENESENGSKSAEESGSGSDDDSSDSSSEESSSDDSSESDDESDSSKEKNAAIKNKPKENSKPTKASTTTKSERSNLDLLLDLGDISPAAPIMTPSLGGFLTPISNAIPSGVPSSRFELVGPVYVSMDKRELLNKTNSHGLQINYRFTRAPHLYSAKMVSIELTFHNESSNELENIHLSDKSSLPANVAISDFTPIAKLSPGQCVQGILGVDFNDSTQAISFEITSNAGNAKVSLKSTVGEVIRAVRVTESTFKEEQSNLRGMNEHTSKIDTQSNVAAIQHSIFETANLALIANNNTSNGDLLLFSGQTMSSQSLVLVTVERNNDSNGVAITVNCEKMVIGSMLLNEIKNSIKC